MLYTPSHVATDLDLYEAVMALLRRATAAVRAAIARARKRHSYRQLLKRDNAYLRDIGVTRDEIRHALAELSVLPALNNARMPSRFASPTSPIFEMLQTPTSRS
jgi:uncharacterized protein YjiS (DUF1127 family)